MAAFLALQLAPCTGHAQDLWLTKAHDARRTGQSGSLGIRSVDEGTSWEYVAEAATQLNIGASVTNDGVFFGSWGLLRSDSLGRDTRFWNKSDGKLFGLDRDSGAELWEPAKLDTVHRCYDLPARERDGNDLIWCGLFNNYHVSFYNGTVEGQATIDTARNVLYLGRGDGKLYAVNPERGETNWRFVTYNPEFVDDPDGGGEVVASPLLAPDGSVYIGTWGEGDYETHAVYGIRPDGTEKWRYPTSDSSLTNRVFASPALSPDGLTLYVATYIGDPQTVPGTLYAFDLTVDDAASDEQRLKWSVPLVFDGMPVYASTMAVGSNGVIFIGGLYTSPGANKSAVAAFRDDGTDVVAVWTGAAGDGWIGFNDGAQYIGGLALREPSGVTERIYVTTANSGTPLFNAKEEGTLFAVDPADGAILFSYDPSTDVPEAVGGLNSPAISADGIVYFGVRGRYGSNARDGFYFAVTDDGAAFTYLWSYRSNGHVEWAHPAIGPDGGIYVGSGVQDDALRTATYDEGEIPEGTSPTFYGLRGPTSTGVGAEASQPVLMVRAPYPNPARDVVRLDLTYGAAAFDNDGVVMSARRDGRDAVTSADQTASMRVLADVYDVLGRKRSSSTHAVGAAPATIVLKIEQLPTGFYLVTLRAADTLSRIGSAEFVVVR